jgi:hypothetical protein
MSKGVEAKRRMGQHDWVANPGGQIGFTCSFCGAVMRQYGYKPKGKCGGFLQRNKELAEKVVLDWNAKVNAYIPDSQLRLLMADIEEVMNR